MGAKYSGSGFNTLTPAPGDTCLSLGANAGTPNRAYTYDLVFANIGTPADILVVWTVQRCTALGAHTAVVPTKLDPADRAAQCQCDEDHTGEPTYTANEELLEVGLNTRATFRWVAAPGGAIIIPAAASNGWGIVGEHADATTDYRATAMWEE